MDTRYTANNLTSDVIDSMLENIQICFKSVRPLILSRAGKSEFVSKNDGSPVTETDSEVEKIIFDSIEAQFPGMPVFGEESGYSGRLPETCWLIDPIDGTDSFIKNIPTFTSMAVLIVNSQAIACIIYNCTTEDTFVARKDMGAYKNGVRLDLKSQDLPLKALCKGRYIDALNAVLKPKNVTCENGPVGAGHGFSVIADAVYAARFQLNSQGYIHDYAPGALLVLESGGCILPLDRDTYTYDCKSFVACHPALEETVKLHMKEIRELEENLSFS
jgi:fructose-1,6-bisphosphatase/inositol monophosphatase family enzyme